MRYENANTNTHDRQKYKTARVENRTSFNPDEL